MVKKNLEITIKLTWFLQSIPDLSLELLREHPKFELVQLPQHVAVFSIFVSCFFLLEASSRLLGLHGFCQLDILHTRPTSRCRDRCVDPPLLFTLRGAWGPKKQRFNSQAPKRKNNSTRLFYILIYYNYIYIYICIYIYTVYDMCVCVSNIVELSNWFKLQLQFFTSLPFNYISPSVCLSVRVDWPDQACCASISPSKGPRSFVQLDSWWTLVHSGDLRRSQAISGDSYSSDGMESVEHVLNMFDNIIRAFLHCKSMHERERERESVFKACSTAFKQLSAPGCNCFGSTLAISCYLLLLLGFLRLWLCFWSRMTFWTICRPAKAIICWSTNSIE